MAIIPKIKKAAEVEKTPEQLKNEKIIAIAKLYVSRKKITIKEAGAKYGVAGGTVSGWFKKYLPQLNPALATKVQAKIDRIKAEKLAFFMKNYAKKPGERPGKPA